MAQKTPFPFDPEAMMDFFRNNDFTKTLQDAKLPNMDADALMQAQRKNMDALVEANKAAAAGYQDLVNKQLAIFEETIAEAQKQLKGAELKLEPDTAGKRSELAQAAFEKAIANMKDLAETAHKANSEAYEIVAKRVKESVDELKTLAETPKG